MIAEASGAATNSLCFPTKLFVFDVDSDMAAAALVSV
jgi:hypothetical protein